ncbi:MAG: ABC transporter permease [Defluviitaleaceae bacterium]|nr:ABC transporter permease [Defluviitaleaceae bacterium]
MKLNVFLKSVFRQPVRTALLAVLVLAASFAVVARVTEFAIVNDAINHIDGQYNAIGNLVPINPQDVTSGHDVSAAAEILANSPLVSRVDERVFVQGVMDGVMNTSSISINPFVPIWHPASVLPISTIDHYFYANITSTGAPRIMNRQANWSSLRIQIEVDTVLSGDTMVLRERGVEFTNAAGHTVALSSVATLWVTLTLEETELFDAGLHPLNDLRPGNTRHLFRGTSFVRDAWGGLSGVWLPLAGDDSMAWDDEGENLIRENDADLTWFVSTTNTAEYSAILAGLEPRLELINHNLSSMLVIGTQSMETMPRMQDARSARLSAGRLIPGGRWLTYEDYATENPVAVIPIHLASRRGLRVGDTLTLTLQNTNAPSWMEQEGIRPWANGMEGWWHSNPQGWWATTEDGTDLLAIETHIIELTIVGIYFNTPPGVDPHNFLNTEMYIPLSLIPDGFGWDDAPQFASMTNFALNSPRDIDRFVNQYDDQMRALGFRVNFMPTGFDNFASAADPIRTSILVNLAIFSFVAVLIFTMVVFVYLKQWRKAVAVSRALGSPAKKSLRQLFTPVFLIWTPAIILGALFAWFFAVYQSRDALSSLEEFVVEDTVEITADVAAGLVNEMIWGAEQRVVEFEMLDRSVAEPLIYAGSILVISFGGMIAAGFYMAKKPVLEQLQGGATKKRRKKKTVAPDDGTVYGFAVKDTDLDLSPLKTTKNAARSAFFRHIGKHIMRSPVKSGLVAVIAMFFVVSLGWLNHTIEFTENEIERLWNTTVVEAELLLGLDEEEVVRLRLDWADWFGVAHAPISSTTLMHYLASGFFNEWYLEALWHYGQISTEEFARQFNFQWNRPDMVVGVTSLQGFIRENTRTDRDDAIGTLGETIEIEFLDGFGPEDFDFTDATAPLAVLVQRRWAESAAEFGIELSEPLFLSDPWMQVQVIGIFDHGLHRAINRFEDARNVFVTHLHALGYHTFGSSHFAGYDEDYAEDSGQMGGLSYLTARGYINPARNRELFGLRHHMDGILARNQLSYGGRMPLEMFMTDRELYSVIDPLEQNLALMRILYPITIGVAAALSIGLSLLIMLQNARNAALMRMLGKPNAKTQMSLGIEQILVIVVGVILGVLALIAIGVPALDITPLSLAAMYFVGAIVGSAIGAFLINNKTPLELLQTKE